MNMKGHFSWRRQTPVILQGEAAECGLACLAMLSGYYGHHVSLATLRLTMGVSLRGLNLAQLMQLASRLGLANRAIRLEPNALGRLKLPAILHWDVDHFVVLERASNSTADVIDPGVGRRRLSLAEFSQHFTGIALEFTPTAGFIQQKPQPTLGLMRLFRGVGGLGSVITQCLMLSFAIQALSLAAPFYSQIAIDEVIGSSDYDLLTLAALGFGTVALLNFLFSAIRSFSIIYFGARLHFGWSTQLFHHLLRLPLDYFERRNLGDILSRFRAIGELRDVVTHNVVESVIDGAMSALTLFVMLVYSPLLAAICLLTLAIYLMIRIVLYGPHRQAKYEQAIRMAHEETHVMESLRAILPLKTFGREQARESTWQNRMALAVRASATSSLVASMERLVNMFLFTLEGIAVIWLGSRLVMAGDFSIGMLIAFMAYRTLFGSRSTAFIDNLMDLRLASIHIERLSDIALTERDAGSSADLPAVPPLLGGIEARGLHFRYAPSDPYVLAGIDISVAAGECVAIGGRSGTGKTTLLKVLLGLLEPESGEVRIDGRPVTGPQLAACRMQMAAVMQDDSLFAGTLADNIAFFAAVPDQERIEQCAKLAQIHDDIVRMPMGYASLVGEIGATLSGGQKQRVLLARALYSQPKVLILDEATCHVDPELEGRIHRELASLSITRIMVAHRGETIAIADRVIEIEGHTSSLRAA